MRNITVTPSGLSFNQTYRMEVYHENTPSVLVFQKDNIVTGSSVIFPVTIPGTYRVKFFNSGDVSNLCSPTISSEQIINAYFPIVTNNISNVDCSTETYTVSLSVSNPETSGNYSFGWGNSPQCVGVNWVDGNIITFPSDGNNKYVFVKYDECCDLVVTANKPPCINCNITIESIVTSCSSTTPPPVPGTECRSFKLTGNSSPSFVFYLDCDSLTVSNIPLLANEEIVICSYGTPTTSFTGIIIEEIGNCPI